MGIFPVEFNMHLIRPLLTVLPNSTFHEHYSTVSSIFRELFLLFHCADRYNGFYSMDYVTECVFVQAGSRFSLPPNVMLSYMRGNLELMLKIYIYFIINEQKYSEGQLHSIYELNDRRNLPWFKLYALLTEHCCPAFMGAVRQLSWAQSNPCREKAWGAFHKENSSLLLPWHDLGTASTTNIKQRKGRNFHSMSTTCSSSFLKFPIQKAEM